MQAIPHGAYALERYARRYPRPGTILLALTYGALFIFGLAQALSDKVLPPH